LPDLGAVEPLNSFQWLPLLSGHQGDGKTPPTKSPTTSNPVHVCDVVEKVWEGEGERELMAIVAKKPCRLVLLKAF